MLATSPPHLILPDVIMSILGEQCKKVKDKAVPMFN